MEYLFKHTITNWEDWGAVFNSIECFEKLIGHIFMKENLKMEEIEDCTPGTNAVFKVGKYILKIFAPMETGIDNVADYYTEKYALKIANNLDIPSSNLIRFGYIQDKYKFYYMIMEYIDGVEFNKLTNSLSNEEKVLIGKELRKITNIMNNKCSSINNIDVILDENRHIRWSGYSGEFIEKRMEYIHSTNFGHKVFVHGDLNGDNILINKSKELYILDFADAVMAPVCYEEALIVCELFKFDSNYLEGYFGEIDVDNITNICLNGLLIHDFGGDIIHNNICKKENLKNLKDLEIKIREKIINGK